MLMDKQTYIYIYTRINRLERIRIYFPFARKMVTKQVRCKILSVKSSSPWHSCWRTVERPRNASEKEWSRQPQSCLSAVGLTGLGSQSKKRLCPALHARSQCQHVCASPRIRVANKRLSLFLSSSLRDSCFTVRVHTWLARPFFRFLYSRRTCLL